MGSTSATARSAGDVSGTFALAPGIYTPGIARNHGYRLPLLGPDRFAGRSVLDIGAFDGFYGFLTQRPTRPRSPSASGGATSRPTISPPPVDQADVKALATEIQTSMQHKDGPPRARSSANTRSVSPGRPSFMAVRSERLVRGAETIASRPLR
jgi:hypothetical protein